MTMKTIKPISTVVFCTAALSFSARAQQGDPEEKPQPPPAVQELFERDPVPSPGLEPGDKPMPQDESERMQRKILDRFRLEVQEAADPARQEFRESPWLIGISVVPIEPFIRAHLNLEEGVGARVSLVADDSPAARAGIAIDDIIVSADGQKISNLEGLKGAVEKSGKEGRPVSLEILHQGQRKTLSIQPRGPKPEREASPQPQEPERRQNNLARRLSRQEKLIAELRGEIAELREKVEKMERDEEQE